MVDVKPCESLSVENGAQFCDYYEFSNGEVANQLERKVSNKFDLSIVQFWDDILNSTISLDQHVTTTQPGLVEHITTTTIEPPTASTTMGTVDPTDNVNPSVIPSTKITK